MTSVANIRAIGTLTAGTISVLMVIAGTGKLLDLSSFRSSLDTWALLPQQAKTLLTVAIPLAEVFLGLTAILNRSRQAYLLIGVLLAGFTGFYLIHVVYAEPPDCNCITKLAAFESWQDSAAEVVVRNSVILALWAGAGLVLWCLGRTCTVPPPPRAVEPIEPLRADRGFTLIETLASIAIIGLLIALLLPTLSGARERARDIHCLASIGSHAKAMTTYQADHRDAFPCFVPPQATSTTFIVAGEPRTINGYFGQVYAWHFGMAEQYYDSQLIGPQFQRPGRDPWLVTDYRYSASFLADAPFWNERTRTGPEQWRGQKAHGVLYPSAKTLLADDRVMDVSPPDAGVIALVDTSARTIRTSEMRTPLDSGEGEWPGTWSSGRFGIHTVDGVRGRDLP
jgi:prepilin-type N-terminal cleavage/methylation domain-containing protein